MLEAMPTTVIWRIDVALASPLVPTRCSTKCGGHLATVHIPVSLSRKWEEAFVARPSQTKMIQRMEEMRKVEVDFNTIDS
uniref:Uncharacterized protein n=1 Tax=Leersia perrieri TaxID=77586 RepID=A0A0D9XIP3_9ORYZ